MTANVFSRSGGADDVAFLDLPTEVRIGANTDQLPTAPVSLGTIAAGQELVFRIDARYDPLGYQATLRNGPGTRNPDGCVKAFVLTIPGGYRMYWEDRDYNLTPGGDYDDIVVDVKGAVSKTPPVLQDCKDLPSNTRACSNPAKTTWIPVQITATQLVKCDDLPTCAAQNVSLIARIDDGTMSWIDQPTTDTYGDLLPPPSMQRYGEYIFPVLAGTIAIEAPLTAIPLEFEVNGCDLNDAPGKTKIKLLVDGSNPSSTTWRLSDSTPTTNSRTNPQYARGDDPSMRCALGFDIRVGTPLIGSGVRPDKPIADDDNDGLLDNWERDGIRIINTNRNLITGSNNATPLGGPIIESFVDLPTFGARRGAADLFVENDWIVDASPVNVAQGAGPLHRASPNFPWTRRSGINRTKTSATHPTVGALDQTLADIKQAYFQNPIRSIKLFMDTGGFADTSTFAVTNKWGENLGGGNGILVSSNSDRVCLIDTVFARYKDQNMDKARRWAFTYGITSYSYGRISEFASVDRFKGCPGGQGGASDHQGSRGHFIQNWGTASATMHEMGHAMGLDHGRSISPSGQNIVDNGDGVSPLHTSVMDPFYLSGIPTSDDGSTGFLDYAPARLDNQGPLPAPLREIQTNSVTELPLTSVDRGYRIVYPGFKTSNGLYNLLRRKTNAPLKFDNDPANDATARAYNLSALFYPAPGTSGTPAPDVPAAALASGTATRLVEYATNLPTGANTTEWDIVLRRIGRVGFLPGEPLDDAAPDDFGISSGLPIPGETQEQYEARQRAYYISVTQQDTQLLSLSATRNGTQITLTASALTGLGTDIDITAPGIVTPSHGCQPISNGFRCDVTSWPETSPGVYTQTLVFDLNTAVQKSTIITGTVTTQALGDLLRGELEINPANNTRTVALSGQIGAIWATATGPTAVNASGAGLSVTGYVHSDGGMSLNGAQAKVTGGGESVFSPTLSGAGTAITPAFTTIPVGIFPVRPAIEGFRPGGADATAAGALYVAVPQTECVSGTWKVTPSQLVTGAVYYVPCKVNLSGIGNVTATIVSEQTITVSGANLTLNKPATSPASLIGTSISISGARIAVTGPSVATGPVIINGADATACGVIGTTVTISGARTTIKACP